MSDNDLIKRSDVVKYIKTNQCKKCSDIGLCGSCAVLIALKLIEDAPAVPQEMSAREYEKAIDRASYSADDAWSEWADAIDEGNKDKAVAIIEKWAKKHPEDEEGKEEENKTYEEDFAERFTNATLYCRQPDGEDHPIQCRAAIYGEKKCPYGYDFVKMITDLQVRQSESCKACWKEATEK